MLCFSKQTFQGIKPLFSLICFLLSVTVIAQDKVDIESFKQTAEQVKELKKTDLVLSHKKLSAFKNQLSTLTIEQNLLYFKLLSEIQIEQNKYRAAKDTATQGLTIAKRLTSPSIFISELLYLKGYAFENLGNINQATEEYKKGLEVAESLHNKVQIASGLVNLGTIAYLTDNFKRALILLNDAYNIASQTDEEKLKGRTNKALGILYSLLQQDKQSMVYYQQSYSHFKKAGMLLAAHNSLNNIATTHIHNENYRQAIAVFQTIIKESNKDTPSDSLFTVYSGMASAHLKKELSDAEAAYQYLLKAKQYLKYTEKRDYQLQFYRDEANILYKLARFDEVLMSIEQVEKLLNNRDDLSLIKKENYLSILSLKGKTFYQQGKFKQAYKIKSKVIALTDKAYENEDNSSITQVRLKLEAEQADKLNKVLFNQQVLYEADLNAANLENEEQRRYLVISALIALAFAWVLVKLIQSQHKLKIASNIDKLTGVSNRRSLMAQSQEVFKVAKSKKSPLSILMIDVDHLKNINDRLGHSVGDEVLAKLAELTENMLRKSDVFGRYGGEEFMICLPNTGLTSAIDIGERMRLFISTYSWQIDNLDKLSISVGVASLQGDKSLVGLIKRVDEKLNQAKSAGRNKVCG